MMLPEILKEWGIGWITAHTFGFPEIQVVRQGRSPQRRCSDIFYVHALDFFCDTTQEIIR
jgi:hypothetical protein